jgi:hypothetical protein
MFLFSDAAGASFQERCIEIDRDENQDSERKENGG